MSVREREYSHDGFATADFVGELTISRISDAHARLTELVASSPAVVADIASDAAIDLTFIQLLQSARRSARDRGGSFRLARPAEGSLLEILERGGFLAAQADREFWLMQGEVG